MSKDLTRYATAKPTATMEAFADFLIAEVFGGKLPKGVDEVSFRTGVALGGSTRMDFQRSETWKADPRNYLANVDARREAKAREALEKAEAAKAKLADRIAKATAALEAAKAKAEAANAATDATATDAGEGEGEANAA